MRGKIGIGSWLTGQWMTGGIELDSIHPGYLLPTAAGGLIGANAAAQVHLHALAEASFGIGVISWVLLGSITFNRLFTRAALLSALVPTMAIELVVRPGCSRCGLPTAGEADCGAGRVGRRLLHWLLYRQTLPTSRA